MFRLIVFSTILVSTFAANPGINRCKTNNDCEDRNQCEGGICQRCLSCELIYRQGQSCVLNFQQCGDCLDGYENTPTTDFSTIIKPCTPVKIIVESEKCWYDKMCPPNAYCFKNSCVKCFNCSLYSRLMPPEGCAKEFHECGSCMDGFYEVPVTMERNVKPCKKPNISHGIQREITISQPSLMTTGICLSFTLILCLSFLYMKKKNISLSRLYSLMAAGDCSEPPPPYVPTQASAALPPFRSAPAPSCASAPFEALNGLSNCKLLEDEEEGRRPVLELEGVQSAKVFRTPSAPYYHHTQEEFMRLNNGSSDAEGDSTDRSSLLPNNGCIGLNFNLVSTQQPNEIVEENVHQQGTGTPAEVLVMGDTFDSIQRADAPAEEDPLNLPESPTANLERQ